MLFLTDLSFLVPVSTMVFGLLAAAFVVWRAKKRDAQQAESMQALAETLHCTYTPTDSFGLTQQLKGFELFKRERRWFGKGKITHILRGMVGQTDVYMFDYTYTVQAGNSRKRITQTVFFANDKNWYLPNFRLRPESLWHKLQAGLGINKDINFEENPEFSDKFWLKSEFEDLVRQKFTPELQGFFLEKPPAHLEGSNYYLIAYKPRKRLSNKDALLFFQHCCQIVQMLHEEGKMELLDLAELKKEADPIEIYRTTE
ncbi:MAG: hypothetical protein SFV22_01965 [Saprospiraceae bacterium]|nr:hypothetical protein [Saprospiraceae bacterium]